MDEEKSQENPSKRGRRRRRHWKPGPKPYIPTPDDRKEVKTMAGIGMTDEMIAKVKGISERGMKYKFRKELSEGRAKGIATLMSTAHQQALNGNTTMLIFLLKTRAGLVQSKIVVDEEGNPVPYNNVNVQVNNQQTQEPVLVSPGMWDEETWNRRAKEQQADLLTSYASNDKNST